MQRRAKLSLLLIFMLLLQSAAVAQVHTCGNAGGDSDQQHVDHMMDHSHMDHEMIHDAGNDSSGACECDCYCGGVCMHACSYAGVAVLTAANQIQIPTLSPSRFTSPCLNSHTTRHERPPSIT